MDSVAVGSRSDRDPVASVDRPINSGPEEADLPTQENTS